MGQIQINWTVIFLIESLICTFTQEVEIVQLLYRALCFRFYVGSWEEVTVGIRQKGFKWGYPPEIGIGYHSEAQK